MRKWLAGCLLASVACGVLGAVAAVMVWRAARPVAERVAEVTAGVTTLADVSAIERELTNTAPYEPPSAGELTGDQVTRFLRVQAAVERALGERAGAFTTKYREVTRPRPDGTTPVPTLPDLLGAVSGLSQVYLDAWRAQVRAMNEAGFSRAEFSWVRGRVYQAAGLNAVRYDARDLERVIRAMADGSRVEIPEVDLPDVPARNKALVAPHAGRIAAWLGLAVFGL
ncbi:MAG: hypothetical protein AB7O28_26730 [Vicinamibacterales bacterium]